MSTTGDLIDWAKVYGEAKFIVIGHDPVAQNATVMVDGQAMDWFKGEECLARVKAHRALAEEFGPPLDEERIDSFYELHVRRRQASP